MCILILCLQFDALPDESSLLIVSLFRTFVYKNL